jgi:hypothetical protein
LPQALSVFHRLRLDAQLAALHDGRTPDNFVVVEQLRRLDRELLRDASAPQASAAARRAFADAWQGWVRAIVIEHADDPALIEMAA